MAKKKRNIIFVDEIRKKVLKPNNKEVCIYMNKTELIASVAAKTKSTKKAAGIAIEAVVESIQKELAKGGKVQLIGFGTFQVRARKERKGRNPQTGKPISIPASKHPVFSAGKALKDAVNAKKKK